MRPMVQATGPNHLLEKTHVGETTQHSSNGTCHGFDFGVVRLQRRSNRRARLMATATTLNSIFRSIDEKGTGKVSRAALRAVRKESGNENPSLSTGFIKLGALTRKTGVIASHVAAVLVIFAVLDDTPQDAHANDLQVETPIELITRE
jgi:hypothetical protein